jgi:hypothetical protein
MKPAALLERAIRNSSKRWSIELDARAIDLIVERWLDGIAGTAKPTVVGCGDG